MRMKWDHFIQLFGMFQFGSSTNRHQDGMRSTGEKYRGREQSRWRELLDCNAGLKPVNRGMNKKGWVGRASDCSAILRKTQSKQQVASDSSLALGRKSPIPVPYWVIVCEQPGGSMASAQVPMDPKVWQLEPPSELDLPAAYSLEWPLQDPLSTGAWNISCCLKYLSCSRSHFTGKETVLPNHNAWFG